MDEWPEGSGAAVAAVLASLAVCVVLLAMIGVSGAFHHPLVTQTPVAAARSAPNQG